jgi:hypothetical protein
VSRAWRETWDGPPQHVKTADNVDGIDGTVHRWRLTRNSQPTDYRVIVSRSDEAAGTVPAHGKGNARRAAELVATQEHIGPDSHWHVVAGGVTNENGLFVALADD